MTQHSTVIESPFGNVQLCEAADAITHCAFTSQPPRGTTHSALLGEAAAQLKAYFQGRRVAFDLPLRLDGSAFQKQVWAALLRIPYGQTCSYQMLAQTVGRSGAARAVGSANARNPIGIIVPCHRVIRASGDTGGYAGGTRVKEGLLALEREHALASRVRA